jgi:predicted nucleic acid-binding protein
VVLDVLVRREPFALPAAAALSRAEAGEVTGYLCATSVTTVYYLATKAVGAAQALKEIKKLLAVLEIAPVNRPVLEAAMEAGFRDFEDAVLHEAARQVGAQAIVTRDPGDYRKVQLPIYSPEEMIRILELRESSDG